MIASSEVQEVVNLQGISKIYSSEGEDVVALQKIDLTIQSGELVAITGHSGSGKSTLMHILGCLDTPTSGNFYLSGQDISKKSDFQLADLRAKHLGFIFQSFNLLGSMTVEENVALPLHHGRSQAISRERVQELLDLVGLGHRLKHRPNMLSGGERQRVAVARALVNDPKIIFADEPTGNLDSQNTETIIELFESLNSKGYTIVLVTHEDDIAQRMKRIIEMRDGNIVKDTLL